MSILLLFLQNVATSTRNLVTSAQCIFDIKIYRLKTLKPILQLFLSLVLGAIWSNSFCCIRLHNNSCFDSTTVSQNSFYLFCVFYLNYLKICQHFIALVLCNKMLHVFCHFSFQYRYNASWYALWSDLW